MKLCLPILHVAASANTNNVQYKVFVSTLSLQSILEMHWSTGIMWLFTIDVKKESLFDLTPLEHIDFHVIGYWTSNMWSLWQSFVRVISILADNHPDEIQDLMLHNVRRTFVFFNIKRSTKTVGWIMFVWIINARLRFRVEICLYIVFVYGIGFLIPY